MLLIRIWSKRALRLSAKVKCEIYAPRRSAQTKCYSDGPRAWAGVSSVKTRSGAISSNLTRFAQPLTHPGIITESQRGCQVLNWANLE